MKYMKGFILRKTVLKPHAWAPNQKNKSTHGNHIKTKIHEVYKPLIVFEEMTMIL